MFEPRLAHTAVIIESYVVVFGGLNSLKNTLISSDIYILCLDNRVQKMIPPSKEKKNPSKRRKVVSTEGVVKTSETDINNKVSTETEYGAKTQQVQLKLPKERNLISGQTINLIMQLGTQEGNV